MKQQPIRPKVLFISPCTPDSEGIGWERRAFSMLRAYSRHMDLDVWLTPTGDNPDIERAKKLTTFCGSVTVFHPSRIDQSPDLAARFQSAIRSARCVHLFRHAAFMKIEHDCVFWDIDELPIALRDSDRNTQLKQASSETVEKTLRRFSAIWKAARRVFASSRLEFHSELGHPYLMPNVYPAKPASRRPSRSHDLLFVGNTNFHPNMNAIVHFAKHILPLLPESTTFTVVGRGPREESLKQTYDALARNTRIRFAFDVESCTPYYQDAAVAVVPLNFGGGTKLKVLEAFGHHCPVVSTTKGCEGLDIADGREVLLRDSPAEFANACRVVMDKPAIGEALARSAHRLLVSEHSQDVLDERLWRCLTEEQVL